MSSEIESVLFDRTIFSQSSSMKKLFKMGLRPIKPVHITGRFLRYRLKDPSKYKKFMTKTLGTGIIAIIGLDT